MRRIQNAYCEIGFRGRYNGWHEIITDDFSKVRVEEILISNSVLYKEKVDKLETVDAGETKSLKLSFLPRLVTVQYELHSNTLQLSNEHDEQDIALATISETRSVFKENASPRNWR